MESGKTLIYNVRLIISGNICNGKALVLDCNVIERVLDVRDVGDKNEYDRIIDMGGCYCAPGLIDLQIYGSGGLLFGSKPSLEALLRMEQDLSQQGTTGFLAAMATNDLEVFYSGLDVAAEYYPQKIGNFWGVHLEGPYISPSKRGAHPEEYIRRAESSEVHSLLDRCGSRNLLRMMTLAPECVSEDILTIIKEKGVVISAGHSNASYSEGIRVLGNDGPVKAVTHLFNAMPPMLHREPNMGYMPAIFEKRPFTSIIVDGEHVHFSMVGIAKRLLGDRLFLITDAVTQTQEGIYPHTLEVLPSTPQTGSHINNSIFQKQRRRYVMPNGGLSGSALTMIEAVQNCVECCGIDLAEAINMASLYPAQLLGLDSEEKANSESYGYSIGGRKGRIQSGYDADLCLFNDKFEVVATYIRGRKVFERT